MELGQLNYLVAVAREGSFTAAAARLHVSQPAISAGVKKLERELGEKLLDRSGPRVAPTAVGAVVLSHAEAALAATEEIRGSVLRHTNLLSGRAAVGVIGSGLPSALPDLLADFAREHPAVELNLVSGTTGDLLEGLADGSLDVAVCGLAGERADSYLPAGLELLVLADGPVVAGVAPGHALAGREQVSLQELLAYPLIVQPESSGLRGALDAAWPDRHQRPRYAYQAAEPLLLGQLAARGLGVAVLPGAVVAYVEDLVAVPLIGPSLRSVVALVWPTMRTLAPAGRVLRDQLCTELKIQRGFEPQLDERSRGENGS